MTDNENPSERISRRRRPNSRSGANPEPLSLEHIGVEMDSRLATNGAEPALGRDSPREMTTFELFSDQREVVLIHHGHRYRLRLTSANKLILTK